MSKSVTLFFDPNMLRSLQLDPDTEPTYDEMRPTPFGAVREKFPASISVVNIATLQTAENVHHHVNTASYVAQLDTIQTEAGQLGFYFAQCKADDPVVPIPLELIAALEKKNVSQTHLNRIFAALAVHGIGLRKGYTPATYRR